jgi:hypothetical protein
MLLSNRAVLTYGFTDGVRPDLGLWRYRWKHTGDCLDPRSLLRKLALSIIVGFGTDIQNRRPTPVSRSTSTTTRANPTPTPTTLSQVSDTYTHYCTLAYLADTDIPLKVPSSSHAVLALLLPNNHPHPRLAAPGPDQAAPNLLSSRSSPQLAPPSLRPQQPSATIPRLPPHQRRLPLLLLVRRLSARSSTSTCRVLLGPNCGWREKVQCVENVCWHRGSGACRNRRSQAV